MSCYFRHMKGILNEAGMVVTPSNKKQIDQAIHQIVGVTYKDYPHTWGKLKQQVVGDEDNEHHYQYDFVDRLGPASMKNGHEPYFFYRRNVGFSQPPFQ